MTATYQLYDKIRLNDGNDAIIKFIGTTRSDDTMFGIEYLSSVDPSKPTLITSKDIKSKAIYVYPDEMNDLSPETSIDSQSSNSELNEENNNYILKRKIVPYTEDNNELKCESDDESTLYSLYVQQISDIKSIFSFEKQLGCGGTCTVTLVSDKNNNKYALKELKKSGKYNEELFAREIQILQLLNDQIYVIDYFDSYQTKENYYLLTTYCSGETLLDHIIKQKYISETVCAKYIYQILTAVDYMHSNDMVHRDLKLDNIIFDNANQDSILKIIDFGDCEIVKDYDSYKELVGTLYYISPECNRERKGWEVKKSDIWSVGVIVYSLLLGKLPFQGSTQEETFKIIEKGVFEWSNDYDIELSNECKEFINGLLCKDTTKRFSAKDALKHNWIGNNYASIY